MFRSVLAAVCLLAILVLGGNRTAHAQASPDATQLASRFLDALEAAQWDKAQAMMKPGGGATAESLQKFWTDSAAYRGDAPEWRGVAVAEWTDGTTSDIFLPTLRSGSKSGFMITVEAGQILTYRRALSFALFGHYIYLPGRAVVFSDGSLMRWYRTPTDSGLVTEVRGPDGLIRRLEIIKSTGPGTLVMLRSAECPDGVCGQTGSVQNGIISWREPKASGGFAGNFMDTRVWVQGDNYVSHMTDPAPYGGTAFYDQNPHLRPVPHKYPMVKSPKLTPEQDADSEAKVTQLEPLVETQVVQALASQQAKAQYYADQRAAKQRSSERVQAFNRAMEGMSGVLSAANEVATENAARSQAELNATIAQMNYQAAQQRQQQSAAQGNPQNAGARPQAQAASSASPSKAPSNQASAAPGVATPTAPAAAAPADQKVAAGQALRFVLLISMRNLPGDKVNSTCYSNVITRPGPPGWGGSGFLPPGSGEQARETIESLKGQFFAQCRASGREISSEGNFTWLSNQTQDQAQRLASTGAKYREDVSVQLN